MEQPDGEHEDYRISMRPYRWFVIGFAAVVLLLAALSITVVVMTSG